ncbi:MAG TPA: tyrosine-type recombinase/integrase [Gemmatales bacterium]|nr:tyrosine-type recombinase/integrase [Gemmatales bacterium]
MRRWLEVTTGYLAACQARGLCEERRKATRRELERLANWLLGTRSTMQLEEIDTELLASYLRGRCVCLSKGTVGDVIGTLRRFGTWLVKEGYWKKNPLAWMRGPKVNPYAKAPQRIGQEVMTKLWEGAATTKSSYGQKQWLSVLALLYGLGLRRGEVARLNVSDWHTEEGLLRADARKTGKQLSLPMLEVIARCMEAYLPERAQRLEALGKVTETALFINRVGNRASGPSLWNGVSRIARRMKVELLRLHQFRHTCASDLLEAGVNLSEVQRILGHASVSTTVRYLHFSDPQRRAAVERHPINDWLQQRGGAA